ncbi:MAG: hypothetical protein WAN66_13750 [Limnoraphis robusta]|uniref:Uncharacterized protein n=1 Tax=Limnoraphis robusta CS-951 TaxID=1637645 RepID=A0A0F5YIP2_9CYAN|nr:hypothetical protein [Limnoraphis robusta]KKD38035.1 hypothetical protein WN50_11040 [Limnoraphis robusta CS-951]
METNNSLFQQTSELTAQEAENATSQELNDSELDAIAGGFIIIEATGPAPSWLPTSKGIMQKYKGLFG